MKMKNNKEYPPLWKQLRNVALFIIALYLFSSIHDTKSIIRFVALGLIFLGLFILNRHYHFMERIKPYIGIIMRLVAVLSLIAFVAYLLLEPNPDARLNAFLLAAIIAIITSIFLIDSSVREHGRVFRAESSWKMRLAALLAAVIFIGFGGVLIAYAVEDNLMWAISCIVLGFILLIYALGATTIVEPLNEIEESPPKDIGEAIQFFLKQLYSSIKQRE